MKLHGSVLVSVLLFTGTAFSQVEPPPPVKEARQISGGVLNGRAISLPKPEYSEEAKAAKLEGIVRLAVVVGEDGRVMSADLVAEPAEALQAGVDGKTTRVESEPVSPLLVDAAQRAALEAKFVPTMLNGVPVKVRGILVYKFVASETRTVGSPVSGINGGVLNGKAISLPKPVYPRAARAVKAQGAVTVQITIGENGEVESASAVSGHPLLRAAAVEAAQGAKFSPTLLSGAPVKVSGVVVYNFMAPDGIEK